MYWGEEGDITSSMSRSCDYAKAAKTKCCVGAKQDVSWDRCKRVALIIRRCSGRGRQFEFNGYAMKHHCAKTERIHVPYYNIHLDHLTTQSGFCSNLCILPHIKQFKTVSAG